MANRSRKNKQEFYLSDEELEMVLENMSKLEIENKSEYYRSMALKGKKIKFEFNGYVRELEKIIIELNKIGTNINQIAKITNERRNIYHEDILILKKEMNKANEIMGKEFDKLSRDIRKARDINFLDISKDFKL